MITFFTTYKNFDGHIGVIQRNAIQSWRNLSPEIEIILFDESSVAEELSKKLNCLYIPKVKKNEKGTPFLSEMFYQAQKIAKYPNCCFINCDIILNHTFIEATQALLSKNWSKFLMVGLRLDLDWELPVDFTVNKQVEQLYKVAEEKGELHGVSGIDYFLFSKGLYQNIPPFLAGRAGFDNWLIWSARTKGPVLDGSNKVYAIHQNHDYNHLKTEKKPSKVYEQTKVIDKLSVEGEEGVYNIKLFGKNKDRAFNILDSTWKFAGDVIIQKSSRNEINRYLGKLAIVYPKWKWFLNYYKRFYRRFLLPQN